jgi:hypothetical protein
MARARFLDQVSLGPSNVSSPANVIVQQTGSVVGVVDTLNFSGSGVESITLTGSVATIYLSGGSGSGAQGVQGAQGAQGAQGIAGAQGTVGAQGAVGAQGIAGAQGVQGTVSRCSRRSRCTRSNRCSRCSRNSR